MAEVYLERKENLKKIGFKSYQDYLDSKLWKIIRGEVWRRDHGFCRGCGKKGTEIHHYRYSVKALVGAEPHHLFVVCRDCHSKIEFDENGNKLDLIDAKRKTLCIIGKLKFCRGVSNSRIGYWHRDQINMNKKTKDNIYQKLKALKQ